MNYIELADLLGVQVNINSYTYKNTFRKYMDIGEGINNSKQLAYKECIIEDITNLRGQINYLQGKVEEIEFDLKKR